MSGSIYTVEVTVGAPGLRARWPGDGERGRLAFYGLLFVTLNFESNGFIGCIILHWFIMAQFTQCTPL